MQDILNLLISAPSRLIRVSLGTRIDKTRWALVYWFLRQAAQQVLRSDCRTAAVTAERACRRVTNFKLIDLECGCHPLLYGDCNGSYTRTQLRSIGFDRL